MKNDHELRKEIISLAGWMAEGESLPAMYAAVDMSRLVSMICVDKNQTVVSIALITMALAKYIEKNL